MRETIHKMLKEEDFGWTDDIPTALPTMKQIKEKTVTVPLTLEQVFGDLMYKYITVTFEDGRVVEFTTEGYDTKYDTYKNWEEFDDGTGNDINSLQDYLNEYNTVEPLSETTNPKYKEVGRALLEVFPNNVTEIYFGDL